MIRRAEALNKSIIWIGMLLPAIFALVPFFAACLLLIRYSFDAWDSQGGIVSAWSIRNYATMLGDPFNRDVLKNTLLLGSFVTLLGLIIGYPVAYAIAESRNKHLLILLVVVPLWMDVLIRAYGWIVLLSRQGLVNSSLIYLGVLEAPITFVGTRTAVVLDLLHETLPFMIVTLFSVLQRLDPTLRDAAMNLGANKIVTFWNVTLPLSLPGVLASTILAFSLSISAFAGPLILGNGKIPMMSLLIFQQMTYALNWPLGAAEAVTLMIIVVALLSVYGLVIRRMQYRVRREA